MKAPTPKAGNFNTLTLTGISVLWAVMLGLISSWWMIAGAFCLLAGYGSELRDRI